MYDANLFDYYSGHYFRLENTVQKGQIESKSQLEKESDYPYSLSNVYYE